MWCGIDGGNEDLQEEPVAEPGFRPLRGVGVQPVPDHLPGHGSAAGAGHGDRQGGFVAGAGPANERREKLLEDDVSFHGVTVPVAAHPVKTRRKS